MIYSRHVDGGPSLSFIFFANFQGSYSYSCYFGDLGNIYLQFPIKFTFAPFAFFSCCFGVYQIAIFVFFGNIKFI